MKLINIFNHQCSLTRFRHHPQRIEMVTFTNNIGAQWRSTLVRILQITVLYSTYYKPMGDLPYISYEQGRLIIGTEPIYEYTIIVYKNFELKRVGL